MMCMESSVVCTPVVNVLCGLYCWWRMRNFETECRFVPFEPSRFFALCMIETVMTGNSATGYSHEMSGVIWL
jgi:hypothetical protein